MKTLTFSPRGGECCNPSLGLVTKARAYMSVGQEGSMRGTSYIPGSARECERLNPHIPE
jgi:hypothetical protein